LPITVAWQREVDAAMLSPLSSMQCG